MGGLVSRLGGHFNNLLLVGLDSGTGGCLAEFIIVLLLCHLEEALLQTAEICLHGSVALDVGENFSCGLPGSLIYVVHLLLAV